MEKEQLIEQIERSAKDVRRAYRTLFLWLIALALLVLASTTADAQSSDAYISVSYGGYSNGQYKILIASNQGSCNADVHVQLNGKDFYGKVGAFYIKSPYSQSDIIEVTDLSICEWKGVNPIPVYLKIINYVSTPVTFTAAPKLTAVKGGIQVDFDVTNESEIAQYVVHLTDGNGKKIDMAIPVNGGGHYSTVVKF